MEYSQRLFNRLLEGKTISACLEHHHSRQKCWGHSAHLVICVETQAIWVNSEPPCGLGVNNARRIIEDTNTLIEKHNAETIQGLYARVDIYIWLARTLPDVHREIFALSGLMDNLLRELL